MADRPSALQNALLFGKVPQSEVDQLAPLLRTVLVPEHETFAVRGQPLSGLVLVESGALEVLFESSPICCLSPGSLFGEDALVSESVAPATLRAAANSRLGLLDRTAILTVLPRLPHLRAALEDAYRRRVLAARIYQIDLFQVLSPGLRAQLLERFEVVQVPAGTTLAERGQPGDAFYFLREGEALLHLPPDDEEPANAGGSPIGPGRPAPRPETQPESIFAAPAPLAAPPPARPPTKAARTATLHAGDYLGDTALVDDRPHTATVTTPAGLVAMRLTRAAFLAALAPSPGELAQAKAAYRRRSESML
jgi:CRP-like cAMP-binding protein